MPCFPMADVARHIKISYETLFLCTRYFDVYDLHLYKIYVSISSMIETINGCTIAVQCSPAAPLPSNSAQTLVDVYKDDTIT